MSDGWRSRPAGSVARIEIGGTPAREQPTFWADQESGHAWASIADLRFREVLETAEYISDLGVRSSNVKLIPIGTPIMSFKLTIGRTSLAGRDMYTNEAIAAFFADPTQVDRRYLLHMLPGSARSVITDVAIKGATLNKKSLSSMRLLLPPIEEQRCVAEILDSLDDQIRLTADLISKLDLTGRGLLGALLSRGVDILGKLRPIGSFEARRGASGSFPASWAVVRLDQIADVDRGKFGHRPRNDPMYLTGPFPFIQTGDIATANGGVIVSTSQSLSRLGAAVSCEFAAGTIAVTIAANIADTAILGRPMYFPDSVVGVSVHNPHRLEYVQFVLRSAKPRLEARAPQSAQRNINLQDLRPLEVPLPDPAEQSRICQVMEAHAGLVAVERDTLAKLLMQKTALLDDLLTGRVRVPEEVVS